VTRPSTILLACGIQYYGAGSTTTAGSISRRCTRSSAISIAHSVGGRGGNSKGYEVTDAGQNIGSAEWPDENPGCSLIGSSWVSSRRLDDGSRMSGDVHVRFCERLGVRLPRATHPICHCRSEAQALKLRQALEQRFAECRLQRKRPRSFIAMMQILSGNTRSAASTFSAIRSGRGRRKGATANAS
jgi:hypothetical protein